MIRIPHLETDVTTACQLSCVACNHHVPLWRKAGPTHADPKTVAEDLNALARFLRVEAWGALGGEPTLNPKLGDVIEVAKSSGIANEIEIWSNGLNLISTNYVERSAFWSMPFDRLVLSVYPDRLTRNDVKAIHAAAIGHGKKLRVIDEKENPNFRTLFERRPTGPVATKAKFDGCFFRSFSRVANDGWFYTCCCAPHMPTLVQGREKGADGIRIEGLNEEALRAYLMRDEPLGACSICAGRDTARPIVWHERRDPSEWLSASGLGRER